MEEGDKVECAFEKIKNLEKKITKLEKEIRDYENNQKLHKEFVENLKDSKLKYEK